MAIYFITEFPDEWIKWQEQTKVMQQIKDEKSKDDAKPQLIELTLRNNMNVEAFV